MKHSRRVPTATLRKLNLLDEARQEIRRAIQCGEQFGHASAPWAAWAILANIERDAGRPIVAAEEKRKAIECYVAYRRDGGENHHASGRICFAVTQSLLTGDVTAATALLDQLATNSEAVRLNVFLRALQAIVTGSRDRTLADDLDLDYTSAAEILFLIETLENTPS